MEGDKIGSGKGKESCVKVTNKVLAAWDFKGLGGYYRSSRSSCCGLSAVRWWLGVGGCERVGVRRSVLTSV